MKYVLALILTMIVSAPAVGAERIIVFAAASMTEAVTRAGQVFSETDAVEVVVSSASSSVLARQIAAGAPADLFISANGEWMDWLEKADAIRPETRRTIAANQLVIASKVEAPGDPQSLLAGRFAMGDPSHVPAGQYARQSLAHLELWDAVSANAVFGENVRVALELVQRGEVGAAIVYQSDLIAAPQLRAAYVFPNNSHEPIFYPAAVTKTGSAKAQAFLDFLVSGPGQEILKAAGFSPVAQDGAQ